MNHLFLYIFIGKTGFREEDSRYGRGSEGNSFKCIIDLIKLDLDYMRSICLCHIILQSLVLLIVCQTTSGTCWAPNSAQESIRTSPVARAILSAFWPIPGHKVT